jgi:hypothetical protein
MADANRILITGAAGMITSDLVAQIAEDGCEVVCTSFVATVDCDEIDKRVGPRPIDLRYKDDVHMAPHSRSGGDDRGGKLADDCGIGTTCGEDETNARRRFSRWPTISCPKASGPAATAWRRTGRSSCHRRGSTESIVRGNEN